MSKCRFYLLLIALCGFQMLFAKDDVSYNLSRALESLKDRDYNSAQEYVKKELEDNPKNAEAYLVYSNIAFMTKEYNLTDEYAEKALSLFSKKEYENKMAAYMLLWNSSLQRGDTTTALKYIDNTLALKLTNTRLSDVYIDKASVLYDMKKWKESKSMYQKAVALDAENTVGYYGSSLCSIEEKLYDEALDNLNKCIYLVKNSYIYYYKRAEVYLIQKQYENAVNDLLAYVHLSGKSTGFIYLCEMYGNDELFTKIMPYMKINSNKFPNNEVWYECIAYLYSAKKDFCKSIENYFNAAEINFTPQLARTISVTAMSMGNNKYAIEYAKIACMLDTSDVSLQRYKATCLTEGNYTKEALHICDSMIAKNPKDTFSYSSRAYVKWFMRDYKGALDDYSKAIELAPDHYSFYSRRASMQKLVGNADMAKSDMQKYLDMDENAEYKSSSYYYLGDNEKAKQELQEELKNSNMKNLSEDYYNTACIYSLMGEKQNAIDYLNKSVDAYYRNVEHLMVDSDLDNLRDLKEYKELVERLKKLRDEEALKQEEVFKKGYELRPNGIYSLSKSKMHVYFADKSAEYVGGVEALMTFIRNNVSYPKEAADANINGRVMVSFIINEDGTISDIMVVNKVHELLDKEAIRVVKSMPNWIPAEYKGEKVKSKFVLPISFSLK